MKVYVVPFAMKTDSIKFRYIRSIEPGKPIDIHSHKLKLTKAQLNRAVKNMWESDGGGYAEESDDDYDSEEDGDGGDTVGELPPRTTKPRAHPGAGVDPSPMKKAAYDHMKAHE